MPLPPSVDTKTVEINATDLGGGTTIGRVVFKIRQPLAVPIDNEVIFPEDIEAVLTSGAATVELPPTNDPSVSPTDFVIYATAYTQQGGTHEFKFQIPHDAAEPVQFADLINTTVSAPNASLLTVAQALAFITAAVASEPVTEDAVLAVLATATILASQISGELDDANIPSGITRDSELTTILADYVTDTGLGTALADYQLESEKDQNNGYAGLNSSGLVPDARIDGAIARDSEVTAAINALSTVYMALAGTQSVTGAKTFSALLTASNGLTVSGALATLNAGLTVANVIATLNAGLTVNNTIATFNAGLTATTIAAGTMTALTGTFQGSYSAYSGSTNYVPRYRITQGTAGDEVSMRGRIVAPTPGSYGETILTGLPAAARPAREVEFTVATNDSNPGSIRITTGGDIINMSGNIRGYISLDNVRYFKGTN